MIVNLLLNRALPWLDVDSHLPYKGQVDLRLKQDVDLNTRFPEWVDKAKVKATIKDSGHPLRWEGPIARLGKVRGGSVVTLSFPISERVRRGHRREASLSLDDARQRRSEDRPSGPQLPVVPAGTFPFGEDAVAVNRAFHQLRNYPVVAVQ